MFQLASLMSSTFRLSLFFKELADKIGSHVGVVIGDTISYDRLESIKDKAQMLNYLRNETYRIGGMESLPPAKPAYRIDVRKKD